MRQSSPAHATSLVGREEELGALLTLLDDHERLPALAVVAGDAGIGKTALWLAGVEAGPPDGYLTLTCQPTEAEAGYSFAGMVDLIGGVAGDVLSDLPAIRYVRMTFLPGDETCFHVLVADTAETVAEVCRRAGLASPRIVPALE
jgi:hypothetical protein